MNRLALAASLLLWGWHGERLWLALVLLGIVEACGWQPRRWHFGDGDWQRVLLVSAVLLVGTVVYAANVSDLPAALFVGVGWLPVALFPLVVVQRLSSDPGVPLSVFLAAPAPGKYLDFALPFAAATLLAAAGANSRSPWFFPALIAATALSLWPLRRRGGHPLGWLGSLGIAAAVGFGLAIMLDRAQASLEEAMVAWLSSDTLDTDSDRSITRIGTIGHIKLSGRVVLRVKADRRLPPSLHLVEATYDELRGGSWLAPDTSATTLGPGPERWDLGGQPDATGSVRIEARLADGKGVLPLPLGAARIASLPAATAVRNRLGSVTVGGAGDLIAYSVETGGALSPPTPRDLVVPAGLVPALEYVENETQLARLPPAQRIAALEQFFNDKYQYTLDVGGHGRRSLADFLTTDRAGHCEYFASATAMLLRHAGVPARYAVGFLAHDYSPLERAFLVRSKDAHAWVMAWIDGQWQVADTTPGNWPELEAGAAPIWDPVALLVSRAWFAAQSWWTHDPDSTLELAGLALLVGLVVLVRLWRQQRSEASRTGARAGTARPHDPFADGAFAAVAQRLQAVAPLAGPHETVRQWVERASRHARVRQSGSLDEILALQYRHCYDPRGAGVEPELRRRVTEWTGRFDATG